jgi:epsilon-lactone hydrolase
MLWFQTHHLPRPAAIGIFCAGAGSPTGAGFGGDATYTAQPLGEARVVSSTGGTGRGLGYLEGTNPKDPLVAPINSPETLARFPPTLIITGTRGFELSAALYTHTQLVKRGSRRSCTCGKASSMAFSTTLMFPSRRMHTTSW